jgi:hypothetical protein
MASKTMYLLKAFICAVLIVQLSGCGTIMYPGRRGQQGGKIDAGVAVLDGVGLLLFIIPGVIAFAVDFSTGAIYLPGTSRSSLGNNNVKVVSFDPRHITNENMEKIINKETGCNVKLDEAVITRLQSDDDVKVTLAKVFADRYETRISKNGDPQ